MVTSSPEGPHNLRTGTAGNNPVLLTELGSVLWTDVVHTLHYWCLLDLKKVNAKGIKELQWCITLPIYFRPSEDCDLILTDLSFCQWLAVFFLSSEVSMLAIEMPI